MTAAGAPSPRPNEERILPNGISRFETLNRRKGSAAVHGGECRRRLAASPIAGRDARPTRRRDAGTTRFMGRAGVSGIEHESDLASSPRPSPPLREEREPDLSKA